EQRVASPLEQPCQIAVSKNAAENALRIDDHDRASPTRRQPGFDKNFTKRACIVGQSAVFQSPHCVIHTSQLASETSARMIASKIIPAKSAHSARDQCESIADREHRRRAGAWGEAERACFLQRPQIDDGL